MGEIEWEEVGDIIKKNYIKTEIRIMNMMLNPEIPKLESKTFPRRQDVPDSLKGLNPNMPNLNPALSRYADGTITAEGIVLEPDSQAWHDANNLINAGQEEIQKIEERAKRNR